MKKRKAPLLLVLFVSTILLSCSNDEMQKYPVQQANWKTKTIDLSNRETLVYGQSYLPTYSHIYHVHDQRTFDLTTTVSIRNISPIDTVFLTKAAYVNTLGKTIRQYLDQPIFLVPMETIEIVVNEQDLEGGSGANFLFDYATKEGKNPPHFEAVMISTHGQQGISFTSQGIVIEK